MDDQLRLLPEHDGPEYGWVVYHLHRHLRPQTYFEIGTAQGRTLSMAQCASVAIDPAFRIDRDVIGNKPSCALFQLQSDAFFAKYEPRKIFGSPIDLAFLDGMHHYEVLLRDFINTERSCAQNSVILLHDCLPTDRHVARREVTDRSLAEVAPHPDWWAGDVWKAAAIIRQFRPDLTIAGIGTPPTGLIAITNLDPTSDVLQSAYDEAVREFAPEVSPDHGVRRLARSIRMFPPGDMESPEGVRRLVA